MCLGIPGQIVELHPTVTSTSLGSTSAASAG